MLWVTIVGTLAAVAVIAQLEPRYRAEALLLLEPRPLRVVETGAVLSSPDVTGERELASSEVEILRSDALARRVIERLDLLDANDLQPRPGLKDRAGDVLDAAVERGLALLRQALIGAGIAPPPSAKLADARAAAPAAPTAPEPGPHGQVAARRGADEVDGKLAAVRRQLIAKQADLRLAQALRAEPERFDDLAELLNAPQIARLRAEEAALRRQRTELVERHGDNHPSTAALDGRLAEVSTEIDRQTKRATRRLEDEIAVLGVRQNVLTAVLTAREQVLDASPEPPPAPRAGDTRKLVGAIGRYQGRLSVDHAEPSSVIRIRFDASDPELAARIVNEHAAVYLADQLQAKLAANEQAQDWLQQQVTELRTSLRAAETAAQEYRNEHQLLGPSAKTVIAQRLSALNSRLVLASAELASKEAELRQLEAARTQPNGLVAIGAVFDAQPIQELREQEAELLRQRARLSNRYAPRHPNMVSAHREIADLRGAIDAEVAEFLESRRTDLSVARQRITSLQAETDRLEARLAGRDDAELGLRELEREANAQREVFEHLLQRYTEILAQGDPPSPDARVVSEAMPPNHPSFPRTTLFAMLAVAVSGVSGLGLALLLDRLECGIRSSREFEALFGSPCLGVVPQVRRRLRPPRPHDLVVTRQGSPFAEAVADLASALVDGETPPSRRGCRVLTVSSSLPAEGKTVLAVAVGRSLAMVGWRVLLIDGDRHNSRLAQMLVAEQSRPGLGAVLAGAAKLEDAVQRDGATSLRFIAASPALGANAGLYRGGLRELLIQLRHGYDLILLDTPPLAGSSDVLALGPATDGVVFVTRWRNTPRAIVASALRALHLKGAGIVGGVLTCADFSRPEMFTDADFERYHAVGTFYRKRVRSTPAVTRPLLSSVNRGTTAPALPPGPSAAARCLTEVGAPPRDTVTGWVDPTRQEPQGFATRTEVS